MAVNKLSRISNASSISRRRIAITNRACQEQWPILLRSQVLWTVSWLQKDRFFLFSLSLSLPSPLPPPLLPRSRESKGVGRGIGRRGGVTLFGAKQTKRKRFVRSKISPRAFTRLAFLIDYPSLPFTLPLKGRKKGGREMVVGFFLQRLCEVKAALSPLSSYSISNREWSIPTRFFLFFGQFIIECGWIEDLAVKREDSFVTVVELLLLLLLLLRYD